MQLLETEKCIEWQKKIVAQVFIASGVQNLEAYSLLIESLGKALTRYPMNKLSSETPEIKSNLEIKFPKTAKRRSKAFSTRWSIIHV